MSETQTGKAAAGVIAAARPNPVRWRRIVLKVVLLLAVFVGGGVAGASLAMMHFHHRFFSMMRSPEKAADRFLGKFHARYELDELQAAQVDRIVRRHFADMGAIRAEVHPRFEAELDKFERDLSALLDEPQRTKWQEEFRALRRRAFPPPPEQQKPHGARQ